jgi:3-oxoacyl-[acyl-carrier protein] reductase
MIERRWGRIVQISSAAARDVPGPFNTAYAVSKIALDRLLAQLAVELAGTGVTVCSLHPGEIASAMRDNIADQAAADRRLAGWTDWADRTATAGDDPRVAATWVAELLDDDVAAARRGRFGYPQQGGRTEPL